MGDGGRAEGIFLGIWLCFLQLMECDWSKQSLGMTMRAANVFAVLTTSTLIAGGLVVTSPVLANPPVEVFS